MQVEVRGNDETGEGKYWEGRINEELEIKWGEMMGGGGKIMIIKKFNACKYNLVNDDLLIRI